MKCIRLIEQGLTSHQTHCRSYRAWFLQVIWPKQRRKPVGLADKAWIPPGPLHHVTI